MRTKISKIAKDLNVGVSTVSDFLRKNNIEVDANPNARVDDNAVALLMREFSNDKADKDQSDQRTNSRREDRKAKTERKGDATAAPGLKVLGKIDLDTLNQRSSQGGGGGRHQRGNKSSKQSSQNNNNNSASRPQQQKENRPDSAESKPENRTEKIVNNRPKNEQRPAQRQEAQKAPAKPEAQAPRQNEQAHQQAPKPQEAAPQEAPKAEESTASSGVF